MCVTETEERRRDDGNEVVNRHLSLAGNKFSGTVPENINQLQNLNTLFLTQNEVSGTIPQTLWSCTNLMQLDLRLLSSMIVMCLPNRRAVTTCCPATWMM